MKRLENAGLGTRKILLRTNSSKLSTDCLPDSMAEAKEFPPLPQTAHFVPVSARAAFHGPLLRLSQNMWISLNQSLWLYSFVPK